MDHQPPGCEGLFEVAQDVFPRGVRVARERRSERLVVKTEQELTATPRLTCPRDQLVHRVAGLEVDDARMHLDEVARSDPE